MKFVQSKLIQFVVLVHCMRQLMAAQRNSLGRTPEDCLAVQYYDPAESKCRNCSEVLRVFEMGPLNTDWQLSGDNKPNQAANKEQADTARNFQSRTDAMSSIIGSRLTPLPPTTTSNSNRQTSRRAGPPVGEHATADAILSRLVLGPQPSSYQTEPLASEGEEDELDQADSLASIPSANPSANSPQLDESGELRVDLQEQEQTNSASRLARLWQKLLWDFLQSSEISESSLLDSIEQCRSIQNLTACQMWANMCVMTMYSHSADSSTYNGASQASSSQRQSTPRRPSTRRFPTSGRARDRLDDDGETASDLAGGHKIGWQQCAKFNLASLCNGWRDWRRLEKQQAPNLDEIGDIFGNEDVEASLASRLGALQGPPLRLGQQIQMVAYEYALDGRLVSVHQFGLDDLTKFCLYSPAGSLASTRPRAEGAILDGGPDESLPPGGDTPQSIRVGSSASLRCQFSASQAALFAPKHLNQTKFVELFVGYQLNGGAFVRPVPILLRQLLYQGQLVNLKHAKDPSRWKFVHRYFPFATVKLGQTGRGRATPSDSQELREGNNDAAAADLDREVLIFARSANFEIKLRRQQDKGLVISSMLLILDYDHLQLVRGRRRLPSGPSRAGGANSSNEGAPSARLYKSHIQVSQISLDMQAYVKDLDLFVTIICITSSIWVLIKCYNIQKYQGLIKLDIHSLCLFLVIACDILANLLGLVTIAFALFLFVALKMALFGDQQRLLAPDDNLEQNLLLKLTLAFSMKLVGLLYKLAIRLRADVFFIDWERPKMLTSAQIMSQQQRPASTSNGTAQAAKLMEGKAQHPAMGFPQQQQHHIGFWRPYMIINCWLQMQTLRRQNLTLQLVAFLSLIELLKLDRLATTDSRLAWPTDESREHSSVDMSPLEMRLKPNTSLIFRALILALVYLCLASVQILYKKLFHEQMIRCPVREFVDLCSVGNVSLFAMLYSRYGFYVHGRNANGSSDCGLVEMNVLLEREERDLCSRRGLLPESDQQTFELVLPKIINDHYRKLLFRFDHSQLQFAAAQPLHKLGSNRSPLRRQQAHQPAEFIRSALSLPGSLSPATTTNHHSHSSSTFGSMRAMIESAVARNRAINMFLINFLEHAYKDIDYSIRKRRRFESLLMEIDLSDQQEATASIQQMGKLSRGARADGASSALGGELGGVNGRAGGALLGASGSQNFDGTPQLAATFFVDANNSFASLVWLGLEWDLLTIELLTLLNIDLFLGPECLILTVSLVWLFNKWLQSGYCTLARRNLVTKSMLDEKFLIRA